jgi:N-acetylglucosaminyl-diphospho-decaprenol L-rhamnosyltransferase
MISIVIANWNSGRLLENCVRSLFENASGAEITVVDNASSDSSLSFMEAGPVLHGRVSVIRNDDNLGFAAACNQGWRASAGCHILFLNPDTECLPGSIHRLEQTLSAAPGVWAVGGCLVAPAGEFPSDFNVRPFPDIAGLAADMLFLKRISVGRRRSRALSPSRAFAAMEVDQPAAACLMVTKAALESIDGFDESFYPAWFEDVDLCRRIRDHGGRIQFQPGARFLHHGGYSTALLSRRRFLEIYHGNQLRYFRKHHGQAAAARARILIIAGLMIRSALSIAASPPRGVSRSDSITAYWNAAVHLSKPRVD